MNNNAKARGIRAPEAASTEKSFKFDTYAAGRTEKKSESALKKSYSENVEATLKGMELDDASQKDVRDFLLDPLLKKEIITQALQTEGDKEGLKRLLNHVLENKDTLTQTMLERKKAINGLKGKKTYWESQLKKIVGSDDELTQKIKDIGSRIKLLEKQIREAEKNRIDLRVPFPEKQKKSKNNTTAETSTIAGEEDILFQETTSPELRQELLYQKALHAKDDEIGFYEPTTPDVPQMEKTRQVKMRPDAQAPTIIPETHVREMDVIPSELEADETNFAREMDIIKPSERSPEPLKDENQKARFIPIVTPELLKAKAFGEMVAEGPRSFTELMKELELPIEPRFGDTAELAHIGEGKVIQSATIDGSDFFLKKDREGTYFLAFQTDGKERIQTLGTKDKNNAIDSFQRRLDRVRYALDATAPETNSEDQSVGEKFKEVFYLKANELGSIDAVKAALETYGVPKHILEKYKMPMDLYHFTEKPTFWAKWNKDAEKTLAGIDRLIESAHSTAKSAAAADKFVSRVAKRDVQQPKSPKGLV